MRARVTALALSAAAALALSACGGSNSADTQAGATVAITHAQGSTRVPTTPEKVVVLDLAVLDSLDTIGAGSSVVAIPEAVLPTFLADDEGGSRTTVGSMSEPDVEAIADLDPDVILIAGRSAKAYPELSKLAPTVDLTLDRGDLVQSVREQSATLGRIFGKKAEADAAVAALDADIAAARSRVAKDPALILLTSGGKLSAFGPGSRFGLIHDVLGVPAVDSGLKADSHGQAVSFEYVATKDPQRLFVVDRDAAIGQKGSPAAAVLDNPLVAGTAAWKSKQVTYLDGARWYVLGGGLSNLRAMVAEVAGA